MSLLDIMEAMNEQDGEELTAKLDRAKAGEVRLTREELQIVAIANFGDAGALLGAFPAEAVPEEIEDAWRELRSVLPLSGQIEEFLNAGL